ncbi:MAG: type II toxin-antitoxin system YafQ family toxin [Lachnospiraceae bacterium]|nr:type II toxin-antitoxin system YafQ family toxin [Lachnospiraceae bacterium]MCM1232034.1 type II toxin-antitoxin system YafQ family toxin [Ruminococcus flavefaciens]
MREIKWSKRFDKGYSKCKKRGYKMQKLNDLVHIISTREFTDEERLKYKVHMLYNDKRYKNCMELHIGGKKSDWLLIYHIEGNTAYFDDTYVTLENTGTHADCFESELLDNELIWL